MTDNLYATDVSDAVWGTARAAFAESIAWWPALHTTDMRVVINAVFYLLRTGCQWRLLPREFPAWGTVYHCFGTWKNTGVWTCLQREIYGLRRRKAGRSACPAVVIVDGQSIKTTERGGVRGFDAHKRVKGRKPHILVDTLGLPIACRVEPANTSDRRAASLLLGQLAAFMSRIGDNGANAWEHAWEQWT